MTDLTQPPQAQVDLYLTRLRQQLAGLPADDVEGIMQEISGHIAERSAEGGPGQGRVPVQQILRELGAPEHIGSLYRADTQVAHARATFSPALIIRTTIGWATKTIAGFLAFLIGIAGYITGLGMIACAILKPFLPDQVGLWLSPHGLLLGYMSPQPHRIELLGWWLIPTSLAMGASFLLGTTVFLRWMLRFAPRASRPVSGGI